MLDTDNDGLISADELTLGMLDKGLEPEDVSSLFRTLDIDQDGFVSLEEFRMGTAIYHEVLGTAPPPPEEPAPKEVCQYPCKNNQP